jgi:hypothetical protein
MRTLFLLLVLCALPGVAQAEEVPTFTPTPPAAELPRQVMGTFQEQYLGVDVTTGQATQGKAHAPLSPLEFYAALERPDLAEAYRSATHTKTALYITGGTLAAAGIVAGLAELATRPDLTSDYCNNLQNFNTDCVPSYSRHGNLGAGFIAAGVISGAVLTLVGMRIDPVPVTHVEAKALADGHNRALWQRLRSAQGHSLQLQPALGDRGGGLLLSGRF